MVWLIYVDGDGARRGGELVSVSDDQRTIHRVVRSSRHAQGGERRAYRGRITLQPMILGPDGRPTRWCHQPAWDAGGRQWASRRVRVKQVVVPLDWIVGIVIEGAEESFAGVELAPRTRA